MAASSTASSDATLYKDDGDDEMELYEMDPLIHHEGSPHVEDEEGEEHMLRTRPSTDMQETKLPSTPPRATGTEYLDGLRGLAAVCVFIQHFNGGGVSENGFGFDGSWAITTFPFIRLLFSGGNAAVVIFFVLSGYVLTIAPLKKLAQGKASDVRRSLFAAIVRRPIRLYLPPITISFIFAMLLHVPGPLMMPTTWDGGKPNKDGIVGELKFFWSKLEFFSIFQEHGSHIWSYPYNIVMWTLPIELKGSLLVYGVLSILSLGLSGPDVRGPLMAATGIFAIAAAMIQHNWKWSMAVFLLGVVLAICDTWPIGEHVIQVFQPPERVREIYANHKPRTPDFVYSIRERWERLHSVKLTPEWIERSIPTRFRRDPNEPLKPRYQQPFSLWAHICFWIGWWLLGEPCHAGMRDFSAETPGWGWLTKQIPAAYDDLRYYRYWQSWGAFMVVYGVLRIGWLQRFFTRRLLRFFGYVSFMLYLIHIPYFRILPDRIVSLMGGSVDPTVTGSFWDRTFEIPDWGPPSLSTRFLVCFSISFPSALLIAWVATKAVDQPSVKLGRWVTTTIGLEKKRPEKEATESVQLPR